MKAWNTILKRPAFIAFVVILLCLVFVAIRIHTHAWPWLASNPAEKVQLDEDTWALMLSLTTRANFETICVPHANALLSAEKRLIEEQNREQILKDLSMLPGVNGVVLGELGGEIYQYPAGKFMVEDLKPQIQQYYRETILPEDAVETAPILHRKAGGLVRFAKWKAGNDSLDIFVRFAGEPKARKYVLGLVFNPNWVLNQVPAFMDSLYRENIVLPFWSWCVSKPPLQEQTIGITYYGDTLWWDNNRSLKTIGGGSLGLIEGLDVHTGFQWIDEKKENARAMSGVNRWFASAEILGIVALVLALFAIRSTKRN